MSNHSQEVTAYLSLHAPSVGSATLLQLKKTHGSYKQAAQAVAGGRSKVKLSHYQCDDIAQRALLVDKLVATLEKHKVRLVFFDDGEYPLLLREIADPPAALYIRGSFPVGKQVSIVGSRKYTEYGEYITQEIVRFVSLHGIVVISGLALGIDSIAHQATLDQGGKTLAVLACGLEQVYPRLHYQLADAILANGGAIVSEFPFFIPAYRKNFPQRNRIIAGLSSLTIVIEGELSSGTLLTAEAALEYHRTVWAVPGDITRSTSLGPLSLIVKGASPYLGTADFIEFFGLRKRRTKIDLELLPEEKQVLKNIPRSGVYLDQLAELLQLDIAELSSKVIVLELKGLVHSDGAGTYRRLI